MNTPGKPMKNLPKPLTTIVLAAISVLTYAHQAQGDEPDAQSGKIIVTLATTPAQKFNPLFKGSLYHFLSLFFRTSDEKHRDWIQYNPDAFIFTTKRDFDSEDEHGAVKILTLPAGSWGIVGYNVSTTMEKFFPKEDFFIPFKVVPGKVIYIGDYTAVVTHGKNILGDDVPGGPVFVVTDQSKRDIPIAKQKDGTIGDVSVEIPDIKSANVPQFVTAMPNASPLSPQKQN